MQKISNTSLLDSHKRLRERAYFDFDHIFMIVLASVICFFGFRMNSPAIIIGSMIISPLLYTIVSVSSSFIYADIKVLIKKLIALIIELMIIISVAALLGSIFSVTLGSEITDRLSYEYLDYFFVAIFSGIAGAFSVFWPNILESITGIAISVALIPPVIMLGIGISEWNMELINNSLNIVLVNMAGITVGAIFLILCLRVYTKIRYK